MPHEDLSIIEGDKEFQKYLDYVKGSPQKAAALTAMRTDQTWNDVKRIKTDFKKHCDKPANRAHGNRTDPGDDDEGVLHIDGDVKTDRLWGYLKWTLVFVALIAVGGLGVKALEMGLGG